ncbi:MAG: hypothetical protein O7D86_14730 [Proteobacteria bacterium]|nr:hypothetical protein [Pseudomonadota bacterium]
MRSVVDSPHSVERCNVTQIVTLFKGSTQSVEALTDSFTTMAGNVECIHQSIEELPDLVGHDITDELQEKCHSIKNQVHAAIIAFQFYDRMIQKLSHVSHSMDAMTELIIDQSRLFNPHEWIALQEKIRSRYTMESERRMFDTLMNGASVAEALKIAMDHEHGVKGKEGEVDLF